MDGFCLVMDASNVVHGTNNHLNIIVGSVYQKRSGVRRGRIFHQQGYTVKVLQRCRRFPINVHFFLSKSKAKLKLEFPQKTTVRGAWGSSLHSGPQQDKSNRAIIWISGHHSVLPEFWKPACLPKHVSLQLSARSSLLMNKPIHKTVYAWQTWPLLQGCYSSSWILPVSTMCLTSLWILLLSAEMSAACSTLSAMDLWHTRRERGRLSRWWIFCAIRINGLENLRTKEGQKGH